MGQTGGSAIPRKTYQALDGRHTPALAAQLDGASLLHVSGRSGLAGDFQGREAIVGLLETMAEETGGTPHCAPVSSVAAKGEATVLLGRLSGTRRGRHLDAVVQLTVTDDDGILREARVDWPDQSRYDGFWS